MNTKSAMELAALVAKLTADRDVLYKALDAAWVVIHSLHPQQHQIPVGKGICKWKACADIRDAIAAADVVE